MLDDTRDLSLTEAAAGETITASDPAPASRTEIVFIDTGVADY